MDYGEIRSTLVNKLNAIEDRSGHHIYFYLEIDSKDYMVGKLSHSFRGQALDYVISDTAQRLKLNKKEFLKLASCTITKKQHEELWRERNL